MLVFTIIALLCISPLIFADQNQTDSVRCNRNSPTTASGRYAPGGPYCNGQLIFNEQFNSFNQDLWNHELTLAGGHNGEFQWYVNNRTNSFTSNGKLYLRPTLTADVHGEAFLSTGHVVLNPCTDGGDSGCEKRGTWDRIINPIISGKVKTNGKFQFKYGTIEVVAKNPTGDWLWPAIWMMPNTYPYGGWPVCGEIDIMESRGNPQYVNDVGCTLHWGPSSNQNGWWRTSWSARNNKGFNNGYHRYKVVWTQQSITFYVDDNRVGSVTPPAGGFWQLGQYSGTNPWRYGTRMAPFDQEFYIMMNLAIGGTNGFFPDIPGKPWRNGSPTAARDFWWGRGGWLPTWQLHNRERASFIIDQVRVWAL